VTDAAKAIPMIFSNGGSSLEESKCGRS